MPDATFVLTFISALGSGLAAGVFFAFSTFVMPALGRLPPSQGIAAMQHINVKAINPWFMTLLFGTAATSLAAIVAALVDLGESYAPYLVGGGALYLLGTIGVTMAFNVPRNNALAQLDPSDDGAAGHWARYLAEWTRWNHVRTVAPTVAAGLEIAALYVG
ncbi:MAG TPA: anthrone oxygenase family protein [Solirubrobacterales bacterium]|jgi:uncharacterized membrane protein|nr:anthrone oxygenase family protein [Solirubrobacterales bacterium]